MLEAVFGKLYGRIMHYTGWGPVQVFVLVRLLALPMYAAAVRSGLADDWIWFKALNWMLGLILLADFAIGTPIVWRVNQLPPVALFTNFFRQLTVTAATVFVFDPDFSGTAQFILFMYFSSWFVPAEPDVPHRVDATVGATG